MATQNIQNTTTGELGYQVPGATLASGWQPYSAPVATTVPSGQTSTTQASATPTAVVSSGTASNDYSNISKNVNDASTNITNQANHNAANTAAANAAAAALPPPPVAPPKTPEQQIVDTPEAGNMFVYDKATGARSEVASGTPLSSNQTMTDVLKAGAQDTVSVGGTTYKQFSDGTVGAFDDNGNYIGAANQATFTAAKGSQKAQSDLVAIQNGTYPLTAGQKSQLDQITDYYQQLIEAQKTENANVTGNTAGLQNLYGVGGTGVGLSAINKTIADGAAKIAEINRKMVDAVNAMQSAIQTDDINVVTKLYSTYQNDVDAKQKQLDTMHSEMVSATTKMDQRNSDIAVAMAKKYSDTTDPILPSDTPAQVQAKLMTSPSYQQDQKTKQGLVDQDVLDGMVKIYTKTGQIPAGMGTASVALKKAFYAHIGNVPSDADEATVNRAALTAATHALSNQQTLLSATQTSVNTAKSSISRLETYAKPLIDSGSPLLNKSLRSLSGNVLGSTTYSAFENEINTVATEYAKILNGASASIAGVQASSVDDIKNAFNDKVTIGQLETVLDAMKQDMNARVTSQQGTINQIKSDVSDMGNTSVAAPSGSNKVQTNPDGTLQAVSF